MSHIPDEQLQILSDLIEDNLPDGHLYVFVTGEPEVNGSEVVDIDFLSNVESSGASQMLKDVATVLDSHSPIVEEPPPPWSR